MTDESRPKMVSRVAVSACLLGRPCRYDGGHKYSQALSKILIDFKARGGDVVGVCPEELAGLGTPRPAAILDNGDGEAVWRGAGQVREAASGKDLTGAFKDGALKALDRAQGCELAILKERSPSCGVSRAWSQGAIVDGRGVFAALLAHQGVHLESERSILDKGMLS